MKPDDKPPQAILDLVHSMRDIEQRAAQQYRPMVGDILQTGSRIAQHIEHTLDGLLDFCAQAPVELMYRELCRDYWQFDQAATAYCINAYRERWDSDETGGPGVIGDLKPQRSSRTSRSGGLSRIWSTS